MRAVWPNIPGFLMLIVAICFLSGCNIFRKTSVSLEDAASKPIKTKITYIDGRQIKFREIKSENDRFYGILKSNSKQVRKLGENPVSSSSKYHQYLIKEENLESIQLKNRTGSALGSAGIVAGGVLVLTLLGVAAFGGPF